MLQYTNVWSHDKFKFLEDYPDNPIWLSTNYKYSEMDTKNWDIIYVITKLYPWKLIPRLRRLPNNIINSLEELLPIFIS